LGQGGVVAAARGGHILTEHVASGNAIRRPVDVTGALLGGAVVVAVIVTVGILVVVMIGFDVDSAIAVGVWGWKLGAHGGLGVVES
tara:strand:+ start:215 stop:472 length:258 start_codon:yes stop_codon:yes gene_type:complete